MRVLNPSHGGHWLNEYCSFFIAFCCTSASVVLAHGLQGGVSQEVVLLLVHSSFGKELLPPSSR